MWRLTPVQDIKYEYKSHIQITYNRFPPSLYPFFREPKVIYVEARQKKNT